MINSDLVNASSLCKTVKYDVHTELWMRYVCFSKQLRRQLTESSPQARLAYTRHDTLSRWSLAMLLLALASWLVASILSANKLTLAIGFAPFLFFLHLELQKKETLISLTEETMQGLFPPGSFSGTLYQFGEELSRRYNITSCVDFQAQLDMLIKRAFLILYSLAGFIYLNTDWKTWIFLLLVTSIWPFFLRPAKMAKLCLRLT